MQGGRQIIRMDPEGCPWPSIAHEILHSAGFWHTQSRADRDQHIRILTQNMVPESAHNFEKHTRSSDNGKGRIVKVPYDVYSLMHYDSFAFAKDRSDMSRPRKATILTRSGRLIRRRCPPRGWKKSRAATRRK